VCIVVNCLVFIVVVVLCVNVVGWPVYCCICLVCIIVSCLVFIVVVVLCALLLVVLC